MSLNALRVEPRRTTAAAPERTLHAVAAPQRRRRPRLAYAMLALGGALAIGAAQIGLSLAATQDAFVLAELTSQQRGLDLQKQSLQEELVGLSSPQNLASKAAKQGLVVAGSASYLRLSDGQVRGTGEGSGWTSTVDPNGAAAVGNALLKPAPVAEDATQQDAGAGGAAAEESDLPPAITDGLPSPVTH